LIPEPTADAIRPMIAVKNNIFPLPSAPIRLLKNGYTPKESVIFKIISPARL